MKDILTCVNGKGKTILSKNVVNMFGYVCRCLAVWLEDDIKLNDVLLMATLQKKNEIDEARKILKKLLQIEMR